MISVAPFRPAADCSRQASAGHPRARPRAPQHGPEQCEHQVPGGVDAAVRDLYQGDGQKHDGEGEHESQHHGADVPRADVEDEQRASGRDERSGDREDGRRVAQRQIGRELGDQPRDELDVSVVRDQQVPGFLQRLRHEDLQILGVDAIPDREPGARDAHQHHEDPESDRGDLQENGKAARYAPGPRLRGLREQLTEYPDGAARER